MAKITNPDEVKIGHWYTFCCEEDLTQIEDDEELGTVQEDLRDGIDSVWENKEEALEEIKSWWGDNRPTWVPGPV